jgi:hypothetical protein
MFRSKKVEIRDKNVKTERAVGSIITQRKVIESSCPENMHKYDK